MSQQLEGSNPSEAEAERKEAEYQLMLDDLGELVTLFRLPLGEMMNQSPRKVLLDCIEAARKQEAQAADLRDAAESMVHWCSKRDQWWDEAVILHDTLESTTAGADLLERVRQLEGVARFAAVAVEEARNIGIWSQGLAELEEALEALDQHHQGTGAAGERLQQLEGELEELRNFAAVFGEWQQRQQPLLGLELNSYTRVVACWDSYNRRHHQGTGAAGEEGGC